MCGFSGKIYKANIGQREMDVLRDLSSELDNRLFHR